jgi:predicted  nucleic acid-binding Zn-ribbon protein
MDASGFPTALACTRCGQVFTRLTPQSTPLMAACAKCLGHAMQGKPATTPDEWKEVEKRLSDSV